MKRLTTLILILLQVLLSACGGSLEQNGDEPEEKEKVPEVDEPAVIQVATCNLLKPSGRCDEMSLTMDKVRNALAYSIIGTGASLIAFNELDATFLPGGTNDLKVMCGGIRPSWRWKLDWPNDITSAGTLAYSYSNGYAYDSAVLDHEASGYVWLAKSTDTWYTDPEKAYQKVGSPERTCIWIRFRHKASSKRFYFFVSHMPTKDQGGAPNMAAVVNRFAAEKAGTLPAILAGDMNFGPGKETYNILTQWWTDSNTATWGTLSGSSASYHYDVDTFTKDRPDRRIDHILTRGCSASDYRTVVFTYSHDGNEWCPSDHLPVTATITME